MKQRTAQKTACIKFVISTLAIAVAALTSLEVNAAQTTTQAAQYNDAAQSSQDGSNADSALWKVWGGVAVVCTTACVSPLSHAYCVWDNRAAEGTDAGVTRNYSAALAQIGATETSNNAQGTATNTLTPTTPVARPPEGTKVNKKGANPCKVAVSAGTSALSKFTGMKTADQSAKTNTASMDSLNSDTTTVDATGKIPTNPNQGTSAATGASGGVGSSVAAVCASARQTSDPVQTIQCAKASDPTLPAYVNTPQFLSDFKKASGTDFSQFGNNPSQSPADAISQAAAGSLSNSTAGKVAAVFKQMELDDNQVAAYTPGGAGPKAVEEAAPDYNQIMAGMMAQMGQPKNTDAPSGLQLVIFANEKANLNRTPSSLTEDRRLSLFDRITYRYYFVSKKMAQETMTSPQGALK